MNIRKYITLNLISLTGFTAFVMLFCEFYFGGIDSFLINKNLPIFVANIKSLITNLISVKAFMIFTSLFAFEMLFKYIFRHKFENQVCRKNNCIFLYGGLCLYIASLLFESYPFFVNLSYFFIIFFILSSFIHTNPKLATHKYITINSFIWNFLLYQILLILYVVVTLSLQYSVGIKGLENMLVVITAITLYCFLVVIFLGYIIAFLIEIFLRKTKNYLKYNIVNPNKVFVYVIYSLLILLTIFTSFSFYVVITALRNLD